MALCATTVASPTNSIKSANNETMVWVNPAFMTRQISEIASLRDGFKLKITSNKLINKNNAPDEDEKKILDQFDINPNIPYWWEIKNNEFKFIGALKTEPAFVSYSTRVATDVLDVFNGDRTVNNMLARNVRMFEFLD